MKKIFNDGSIVTTCANHTPDKFVVMFLTREGWRCPCLWHNLRYLI